MMHLHVLTGAQSAGWHSGAGPWGKDTSFPVKVTAIIAGQWDIALPLQLTEVK